MFPVNLQRGIIVVASITALSFSQIVSNPNNIITNGGFDKDYIGWNWEPIHGVQGKATVVDGQSVCEVLSKGAIFWEVQLRRNNLTIENGITYALSFDAKSEPERSMIFGVERNDGHLSYDPNAGSTNPAKLTGTMQTFTSTFTMAEPTDKTARLTFSMAEMICKITFDNISLIDSTKITAIRPHWANITEYAHSINANQRGISFRFADMGHCDYRIYTLSGKTVTGSLNQGSASHYRFDFRSQGIASGKYVAMALDGDQRYSKIFSVLP
jgi:hypothetical protein